MGSSDEQHERALLELYLKDIGLHRVLTDDDVLRLAKAIEQGKAAADELGTDSGRSAPRRGELQRLLRDGREAEQTLVQGNLRLVASIVDEYHGTARPALDLIQEGNLGLMKSVEHFDWRTGVPFPTHADQWIRQAIRRSGL